MQKKRIPICEKKSCSANKDGYCVCLVSNDFGTKKCPFYKKKKEEDNKNA